MGKNPNWNAGSGPGFKRTGRHSQSPEAMRPGRGFSAFELTIIAVVICIFFAAGAVFLSLSSQSAYDIMAKHDLQEFVDFQQYYFKLTGRCLGEQGQAVRNDGIPSDINDYTVSEGVSITIVSGDPTRPHDPDNPMIFQAKHEKSRTVFEYNFNSGTMAER
ncbi:hypothetical protein JCM14469_02430 [Desulfatiferula olefinivorans]